MTIPLDCMREALRALEAARNAVPSDLQVTAANHALDDFDDDIVAALVKVRRAISILEAA